MSDAIVSSASNLLGDYAQGSRRYDAMWDRATGQPREHWQALLANFESLGHDGIEDRCDDAERMLQENGVGFDVGARTEGEEARRVAFDPVPVLISSDQWHHLERGLKQRARLLDAVLRDLYGERQLIRSGVVPPELIYRHEGFQLPCARSLSSGLLLYAADVAWDANGKPRVVADRSQAPAGAGYALETRIVCSRILPNIIRAQPVFRLAGFFQTLRESLQNLAPHRHFDPHAVVLSRGPGDPGYFDHAYLASYLGYPLVQGQDLTVREGNLYVKTVEGLDLVDVVLRRLGDSACDALELNPNEDAGVPGLLQVARSDNVVLANDLGAAVLENPGLMAFLPAIARHVLGEALQIDSVGAWWCGDAASRDRVLGNLDRMLVKCIAPDVQTIYAPDASRAERRGLMARIRAQPSMFVGQEVLDEASTPGWVDGAFEPVRAVTRFFLVKSGDDFQVMPGGFSRTADSGDFGRGLSTLLKGKCKDTWVLAGEAERHRIVWPAANQNRQFSGEREGLPSRAAECLYWVGRYAERAEGMARLARVLWTRQLDAEQSNDPADVQCAAILRRVIEARVGSIGAAIHAGILQLFLSRDTVNSLSWCVHSLSRSAHAVRDRWSNDTWRLLDDMVGDTERFASAAASESMVPMALDTLIGRFSSFAGLTLESMTHEDGWRFLMVGRRLERCIGLVGLLEDSITKVLDEGATHQLLESLLTVGESIITHRRRYRAYIGPESMTELLLLDPLNPRSLAAALDELKGLLDDLPRERKVAGRTVEERALLEITTKVKLSDAAQLVVEVDGKRSGMSAFLSLVKARLEQAAEALEHQYFAHVKARRLVPEKADEN